MNSSSRQIAERLIRSVDSSLVPWPADWPIHSSKNCTCPECRCDMLVGPCQCGAWHQDGDFQLVNGKVTEPNSQLDGAK